MANSQGITLTESEYNEIHPDFRSTWTSERYDIDNWEQVRHQYMGKRTLMRDHTLYIEGFGLTITPDITVTDADPEEWMRVSNFTGANAA